MNELLKKFDNETAFKREMRRVCDEMLANGKSTYSAFLDATNFPDGRSARELFDMFGPVLRDMRSARNEQLIVQAGRRSGMTRLTASGGEIFGVPRGERTRPKSTRIEPPAPAREAVAVGAPRRYFDA